MLSANIWAGAPSRPLLSEILAQYTPTSLVVLNCGVKPGAAAASTPARAELAHRRADADRKQRICGYRRTAHGGECEGHRPGFRYRERIEGLPDGCSVPVNVSVMGAPVPVGPAGGSDSQAVAPATRATTTAPLINDGINRDDIRIERAPF